MYLELIYTPDGERWHHLSTDDIRDDCSGCCTTASFNELVKESPNCPILYEPMIDWPIAEFWDRAEKLWQIHENPHHFMERLAKFRQAAHDLDEAWSALGSEETVRASVGYPDEWLSFDETVIDIDGWEDKIQQVGLVEDPAPVTAQDFQDALTMLMDHMGAEVPDKHEVERWWTEIEALRQRFANINGQGR